MKSYLFMPYLPTRSTLFPYTTLFRSRIEGEITQLNSRLAGVEVNLRDLRKSMDQKFDRLDARFETLDAKWRSEERRVGKECRARWWPYRCRKKAHTGGRGGARESTRE